MFHFNVFVGIIQAFHPLSTLLQEDRAAPSWPTATRPCTAPPFSAETHAQYSHRGLHTPDPTCSVQEPRANKPNPLQTARGPLPECTLLHLRTEMLGRHSRHKPPRSPAARAWGSSHTGHRPQTLPRGLATWKRTLAGSLCVLPLPLPCPLGLGVPALSDSLDAAEHDLGEGVDQGLEGVAGADGAEDAAPQLQAVHELPVVHGLVCLLQGAPQSTGSPGPSPSSTPCIQTPASCAPPNPTTRTLPQPGHTPSCAWSWRCAGGWRAGGCTGRRAGRRRWCPAPAAQSASAA